MLVLTRKNGERLLIGDDIEITVVSIRGDQVRLGIAAPRHLRICRRELLDQVGQENLAAARTAAITGPAAARTQAVPPRPSLKSRPTPADTTNSRAGNYHHHPHRERRHAHQ